MLKPSVFQYWLRQGVPNLFVSASPLTSVTPPHWYKCIQDITELRPLASPHGVVSPRLETQSSFFMNFDFIYLLGYLPKRVGPLHLQHPRGRHLQTPESPGPQQPQVRIRLFLEFRSRKIRFRFRFQTAPWPQDATVPSSRFAPVERSQRLESSFSCFEVCS